MKQTQKTAFFKRGKKFTLIELLITIAIIAILAAMLLPALNSAMTAPCWGFCLYFITPQAENL